MADYPYVQPERVAPASRRLQRKRTIDGGLARFSELFKRRAAELGDEIGALLLEHVRTEYVRPITGKGFTDRTGDLRGSLDAIVIFEGGKVRIRFVAMMDYAAAVEKIKDGTYAYLGPTMMDMQPTIRQLIIEEMAAARIAMGVPGFMGRSRIADLIDLGRQREAAAGAR